MKNALLIFLTCLAGSVAGQSSLTNGLLDKRPGRVVFRHANLWVSADRNITDGSLHIANGKVVYAGPDRGGFAGAQEFDLTGKTLYPAFIEMVSDHGIAPEPPQNFNPGAPQQYSRNDANGRYWNEHIRPETRAAASYKNDSKANEGWRKLGFGYVLTHNRAAGFARGTAALVAMTDEVELNAIIKPDAAQAYSFQRSRSPQVYPNSLMGAIALLRQFNYDVQAYQPTPALENVSLDAQRRNASLPILFDAGNKLNQLRAAQIAREFNQRYILRGTGDEYQRLSELKATGSPLVVPVNFPQPYNVADPLDASLLALPDLMHWERAPFNPATLQKAGITLALTTDQLKEKSMFWPNLRKAVQAGLAEKEALRALTQTPANLLQMGATIGTLEPGRQASFIITDKSLFLKEGQVLESWVVGQRYVYGNAFSPNLAGSYRLRIGTDSTYTLNLLTTGQVNLLRGTDTVKRPITFSVANNWATGAAKLLPDTSGQSRFSGYLLGQQFSGQLQTPKGQTLAWSARRLSSLPQPADTSNLKVLTPPPGAIPYPFQAFGWAERPKAETILFKNATLWTNESQGKMEGDVLVENGKIRSVGQNLSAPAGARTIDARGKHLTPGIIDEHSHIAINGGVNECSHSVTAEARVGDVINPDDPNIYRHLAGGVVAVQQLHGSCNSIGGQSSLIKLRWGSTAEEMKIAGADGFIKFALGENVKQSNFGDAFTVRYPQTRMGVEELLKDAFARARAYEASTAAYNRLSSKEKAKAVKPRRDLQLETLLEILNRRRFITCHSYVQSEIAMLMRVADSLGFKVNTFTHILEGYKVADMMKKHGVGASTFADWWYYKMEVADAIPYNAALLNSMGVVTAINSDDAEMGRRLNQEAAKTVHYGGVSKEDAMKMVTLNPAKLLHLDARMGSLKAGKDADLVLWTEHPFAPGAKAEMTLVDGRVLFDLAQDTQMRQQVAADKSRIINLLQAEKPKGGPTQQAGPPKRLKMWHCEDADGRDESWEY